MAYGDGPADHALREAWEAFCERLKLAGLSAFKQANPTDPLFRADALRFLTRNLGQAFPLALETRDPAFPQIHWFTHPTMKLGGDVADFTYRQAWISGEHQYRIIGRKGTARWFNLTVQGPRPEHIPGTDFLSLHEPFGDVPECNIFGHQIAADADGNFELFIGGPERPANWLPTTPGSRKLFIREAFDAWGETSTQLTIERIGMAAPPPTASPERMIDAFGWAGEFLTGAMRDWPEHAWITSGGVVDPNRPNQFPDPRANDDSDARRGRLAAHMVWSLAPGEALIVEMDPHDGFWIFGMGGVFMGSADFLYRPVSQTPARTWVGADGVIRMVVAHEEPGVPNWLDTAGFAQGNLTYRNLLSQDAATFRTRVVPRSALRGALPADTPTVTAEQRLRELQDRYRAIKLRFGI